MIIVITGPTCTKKSKIAIEVAKFFNGEIVNADAFQIYQELNIGTAKPHKEDLKEVKHHLYDYVSPKENYSIYQYQKDARKVINQLLKDKKTVVLVGGSGLYIRSALYDYKFSKNNKVVDLSKYEKLDNKKLHNELKKIDPLSASKIHMNNRKRALRAIAIFLETKHTKTELENKQKHKIIYDDVHIYSVDMPRDVLYERINLRVDEMFKNGLVNEVHYLVNKYGEDRQCLYAIGYKEIIKNKALNKQEVKALIQKNTRNYAKRQLTFIRYQYQDLVKWIKNAKEIIDDIINVDMDARTKALLGEQNVKQLKNKRIAIFGIGGVGGTAAEALVRSGVLSLDLIDNDIVKKSNLNRQILFTNKDIDRPKVNVAKTYLKSINKNLNIKTYKLFFDEKTINKMPFNKFDYVIDAIDSFNSKKLLINECIKRNIPFISSLGMGNRFDSTKLVVATLDNTHDDPLAKKLRTELKKENIDLSKIKVVFSNEIPQKRNSIITSMIFVPSHAGLLLAREVINNLIKKEK